MRYSLIKFKVHGDHNGKLIALEKNDDFPFDIKRVYYIFDSSKDVIRGKHAHKNLQQVIICARGECDFIIDDGSVREKIKLNDPSQGLYLNSCVWREFSNFSSDCLIIVLASEYYNKDDYIHNYDEFIKICALNKNSD